MRCRSDSDIDAARLNDVLARERAEYDEVGDDDRSLRWTEKHDVFARPASEVVLAGRLWLLGGFEPDMQKDSRAMLVECLATVDDRIARNDWKDCWSMTGLLRCCSTSVSPPV